MVVAKGVEFGSDGLERAGAGVDAGEEFGDFLEAGLSLGVGVGLDGGDVFFVTFELGFGEFLADHHDDGEEALGQALVVGGGGAAEHVEEVVGAGFVVDENPVGLIDAGGEFHGLQLLFGLGTGGVGVGEAGELDVAAFEVLGVEAELPGQAEHGEVVGGMTDGFGG